MMTICLMLGIPTAWLIPHLMAKSLASVVVTLTTWWIIFITSLSCEWMCKIKVVTLFLILALDIMIEEWGSEDALIVMLLRLHKWFLTSWDQEWKKKQFEKELMSFFPRENSSSKGENEGRNSLHLLSISINRLYKWDLCLGVKLLRNKWWVMCSFDTSVLIIDLMIWLKRSKDSLKWNLPYNFLRWRWIGIKPKMALIPAVGDI